MRMNARYYLVTGLEYLMQIVVSGATGLVGSRLVPFLRSGGHAVRTLVRHTPQNASEIFWDPADGKIDDDALDGVDAVVHLAGASIASGRWTAARKRAIRDSRVDGTALLATSLAHLDTPPRVFVSTSAVGYYGSRGDTPLTEASAAGEGFLANVVREWEDAARPARDAGIRVVHPRFGVVMAGEGGMLPLLARLFRAGLGGQLGDGRQYLAWVDIDDLVAILLESIINEDLDGPVNAVAPGQVTNTTFTKAMGRVLNRPTFFRVPAFAMRLVAGELADDLILASQRVVPRRLEEIGFEFAYPTLESSLRHELGR